MPAGRPKGAKSKKPEIISKKIKKDLIISLMENLGIVAPAVRAAGISRSLFIKYYDTDEEFRREVDSVREDAIDYVESQLFKQIKDGGAAQTIFYLKTKGKSRGYIEQTDTNMTIDAVRIKYIMPSEDNDRIPLPFDNEVIKLNLPEVGIKGLPE